MKYLLRKYPSQSLPPLCLVKLCLAKALPLSLSIFTLGELGISPVSAIPNHSANNPEVAQHHPAQGIAYHRVGIGGITLSMSERDVKRILGQPIQQEKDVYLPIAGDYTRTLRYAGLKVDLLARPGSRDQFYVYQIEATSSQYATTDGIRVGDGIDKVMLTYGKIDRDRVASESEEVLSYKVEYPSPVFFNIVLQNGIVTRIFCGDFLG
ncbi:MAG: hypothetical protein WCO45_05505 [Pseudanabaena sp. ELA607]|jgi:hypothetical protein